MRWRKQVEARLDARRDDIRMLELRVARLQDKIEGTLTVRLDEVKEKVYHSLADLKKQLAVASCEHEHIKFYEQDDGFLYAKCADCGKLIKEYPTRIEFLEAWAEHVGAECRRKTDPILQAIDRERDRQGSQTKSKENHDKG